MYTTSMSQQKVLFDANNHLKSLSLNTVYTYIYRLHLYINVYKCKNRTWLTETMLEYDSTLLSLLLFSLRHNESQQTWRTAQRFDWSPAGVSASLFGVYCYSTCRDAMPEVSLFLLFVFFYHEGMMKSDQHVSPRKRAFHHDTKII